VDYARLRAIADAHGILLLLQFGSTVSGPVRPDSDLDLAALVRHTPASFTEYARLDDDLQSLFPGQEVDLALLNRADPLFLRKITERCRLLYGSERTLHELKLYAFKRYQDHRRYLALEREWVDKALAAATSRAR
jgi:predicted nucleotidyltransferase